MKVTIKTEQYDVVSTLIEEHDSHITLDNFLELCKKAAIVAGFSIDATDTLEVIPYEE